MQVIALRTLKQFWRLHSQAEIPLKTWYGVASQGAWDEFGPAVDFIAGNRVIFDIAGNKYRLIVHVSYRYKRILVKFVGTHAEYDKIDPERIA